MTRQGEQYFFVMGLVLLGIVISGFSLFTITVRPGGIGGVPWYLHLHGAVFVSWYILFVLQARLASGGNLRLHQTLGKSSLSLVAGIVIIGYFVVRGAYARPDFSIAGLPPAGSVMFPFTDVVNFVIAYGLALANRRVPAAHKRFMLLAGILMIDPAMFRLVTALGGPPPVILVLELALLLSLPVYDLFTRRVPHWASMLGVGLFAGAMACKMLLAQHSSWAAFVEAVFG
jgi:hypothetical protein